MKSTARWGLLALAVVAAVAAWLFMSPHSTSTSERKAGIDTAGKSASTRAAESAPALAVSPSSAATDQPAAPTQKSIDPKGPLRDNLARFARDRPAAGNPATVSLTTALYQCLHVQPGKPVSISDSPGNSTFPADCRGLTLDDINDFKRWLLAAADKNDVNAEVSYSYFVGDSFAAPDAGPNSAEVQDDKRRAMDYLDHAAATGNPDALRRLGTIYTEGSLAPTDYEMAYAYQQAYIKAAGAAAEDVDESYGARLTVSEKEKARQLAQQILAKAGLH